MRAEPAMPMSWVLWEGGFCLSGVAVVGGLLGQFTDFGFHDHLTIYNV